MIKGMQLLEREGRRSETVEKVNTCPVCTGKNGCLCEVHALLIKDFNWVRDYVNSQEKVDSNLVYILEASISDRKSYVINDIEVDEGRLMIEESLEKYKKLSIEREKMLREILSLEKARDVIIEMIKNK